MRILMVNYEFPPVGGGGATATYHLAKEMVQAGHHVTVLTSGFSRLPASERVEGIDVRRLPIWRQRRDFAKLHEMLQYVVFGGPRAAVLGRKTTPARWDIVQSFFVVPSGPVGWWASRFGGIPHVIRLGGGDLPGHEPKRFELAHKLLRPSVRCLLRGAAARVVNSDGLKQRAESIFPGMSFEVICNGVDTDQFSPLTSATHRVPTVLSVSRLIERKGLQLLLPALARLKQDGVQFRLLVAGDGPLRAALEAQTADLGLAECTEFLGLQSRDELPDIYRQADVFCLPSLSEGMANVVLEALATGLPIVASDVPGMAELVEEGANGFVVEAGRSDALVEPLRTLLCDEGMRRRLGEASRRRSELFTWREMAQRYLSLYDDIRQRRQLR